MKPNDTGYPIGRSDQLRALASPLRQEIVDALESAGPCSIADLAGHLRRAADALYFHVRHLVRCGLVVESERKQEGRHAFAVYDVVGRPLRIDRGRAAPRDLARVARGILRLAERDYERGFSNAALVIDGPRRNHWVARAQGWLDESGVAELNRRLEGVLELLRSGSPGRDRTAIAVSFAMTPPESRREPNRSAAPGRTRRAKPQPSPSADPAPRVDGAPRVDRAPRNDRRRGRRVADSQSSKPRDRRRDRGDRK